MKDALLDAKHEARCMELDLADAIRTESKSTKETAEHLQEAIRRHAMIGHYLRSALTQSSRRQGVLSMSYPANLGGGYGPEREA